LDFEFKRSKIKVTARPNTGMVRKHLFKNTPSAKAFWSTVRRRRLSSILLKLIVRFKVSRFVTSRRRNRYVFGQWTQCIGQFARVEMSRAYSCVAVIQYAECCRSQLLNTACRSVWLLNGPPGLALAIVRQASVALAAALTI